MLSILIVIAIAILTGATFASIKLWNMATIEQRTKLFLVTTVFRLLLSVLIFGGSVFALRPDIEQIKVFTVAFAAIYFLLLVFDTGYFYYTSNKK